MVTKSEILNNLPKVKGEYKFAEQLKRYTWLNVGGPAEIMFFPKDIDDLQFFMQNKPPFIDVFVLGGGSNLLVRDGGVSGVVIKLKKDYFTQTIIREDKIFCKAGLLSSELKKIVAEKGLGGLEFLCSIPGSIGGLVYSNAGCFGSEISDVLVSIKAMDGKGNIFDVEKKDLHFEYRKSFFPQDWIILEACLHYKKESPDKVKEILAQNDEYRKIYQPQGIRTAGSTFKNPQGYKAWELIKKSGGADIVVGGARMSPLHCNFIQNDGTATAADIEQLGNQIIVAVKQKTGVDMEWEIKIIGRE